MGNGSVIKPGDVQYMSAGTGVAHSEFNASDSETVHLYQIWMFPDHKGYTPAYDQKHFSDDDKRGKLRLVVSPDGRDGSVKIRQDNELYATVLGAGRNGQARFEARSPRLCASGASGSVTLNGKTLETGDGAAIICRKVAATDWRERRGSPAVRPRLIQPAKLVECTAGAILPLAVADFSRVRLFLFYLRSIRNVYFRHFSAAPRRPRRCATTITPTPIAASSTT